MGIGRPMRNRLTMVDRATDLEPPETSQCWRYCTGDNINIVNKFP
jgi:hypothetical protein